MKNTHQRQPQRGRFQGVAQIVRFNWPRYAIALAVVVVALLALKMGQLSRWLNFGLMVGIILNVWWTAVSLIISHWVYDRSELMRWEWLKNELPRDPRRWLNVHAGLDESTSCLRLFWPDATGQVVDIFAQDEMTESSIQRARLQTSTESRTVDYRSLPFADEEFDSVFIFFTAHELREPAARQSFFDEIRRVLARDGTAVLVEHLRAPANFIAYGPGFLHFHSRDTWLNDLKSARFRTARELGITPFVHVFVLTENL